MEHSYPEPFAEAIGRSGQRAAQITSVAVAAAQAYIMYRARHAAIRAIEDESQAQALRAQERLAAQQARAGWAPALDSKWLARADLLQAASVWGAAMPYAQADATSDAAMRRAEQRLRVLHPYAMSRYDGLRSDGMSAAEAMVEAAPLFGRHPATREGQYAARPAITSAALDVSPDEAPGHTPGGGPAGGAGPDGAAGAGKAAPGPSSYLTGDGVHETAYKLAGEAAEGNPAASVHRRSTAATLAGLSFPFTIRHALGRAATAAVPAGLRHTAARNAAPRRGMVR